MTKVTQRHLWQVISISAFCYLPGGNVSPSCHPERRKARAPPAVEPVGRCVASGSTRGKDDIPSCHPERSPPEIPPSLCSVLLRSSTPLRFAQNDTGGRSRTRRAMRSIGIYEGKGWYSRPRSCSASPRTASQFDFAQDDTGGFRFTKNMSLIKSVFVKKRTENVKFSVLFIRLAMQGIRLSIIEHVNPDWKFLCLLSFRKKVGAYFLF